MGKSSIRKVGLELFTRSDRHQTISSINEAVSESGGYVDDVNFFSNIAVAIIGVFPCESSGKLTKALLAIGLKLSNRELNRLGEIGDTCSVGDEFTCNIHVTFFHNDKDLRQHIPNVPG